MDLIADFEKWLRSRGYRPNTISAYLRYIKNFSERFSLKSASRADISKFATELESPHKVKIALSALSTFYTFAIEVGVVDRNPAIGIKRPKLPHKERNFLTKEEIKRMIAIADRELKHSVAVRLGYFAALRVQELCSLRWEDVSMEEPRLVVRAAKGGRDAIIYYGDIDTLRVLRHWKEEMPEVKRGGFPVDRRLVFPYSYKTAESIVRRIAREAGIMKSVSFHDLRHARATHLRQSGWDIRKLQEFMRHKSILATMRYAHVAPEELIPS